MPVPRLLIFSAKALINKPTPAAPPIIKNMMETVLTTDALCTHNKPTDRHAPPIIVITAALSSLIEFANALISKTTAVMIPITRDHHCVIS